MARALDWSDCLAVDQVKGEWVFDRTETPVTKLFESLDAGQSVPGIMDELSLTRKQIGEVLQFVALSLRTPEAVPKIKLTPVERLQLINQFRILELLDTDESKYHTNRREILENGFAVRYSKVFDAAMEEMDFAEGQYVYDVLDMFQTLHRSFVVLEDKQGLKLEDVRFRGFDGNNESDRHALARHLQEVGNFEEILKGELNSHSEMTMEIYPRMLFIFREIREANNAGGLMNGGFTAEQIRAVLPRRR